MIEQEQNQVVIAPHPNRNPGGWRAIHRNHPCGMPGEISLSEKPLVQNCHCRLDELGENQMLLRKRRCYRQENAAIIEEASYFPFGNQVSLVQSSRYAANHLRVTLDLQWPRDTQVERHLEIGSLWLPGSWNSYFCIPPAQHLLEAASPYTTPIRQPENGQTGRMIGHWHRPPLAIVLHRADGARLEIGSGSDLWRWEQSLGAGPEQGSYKLIAEPGGIRYLREPLMTCTPFKPKAQSFRFKWYLAWDHGKPAETSANLPEPANHTISPHNQNLPETGFRLFPSATANSNGRSTQVCWLSPVVGREVKKIIRQLTTLPGSRTLAIHGLTPGLCRDASHRQRKKQGMLNHWDMDAILDITGWMRRQLGPSWRLVPGPGPWWQPELPSLSGLFMDGGF